MGYKNVSFVGTISRMGAKRKADLKFLDFIASEFSGNNVYVFESYVQNGKRVYKDANGFVKDAPNGMYMANGDIYIDLNAGMEGEGFVLNTFAHELTHHIRDWSPTKFKALADFLVKEYGKAGQSVDELVHARMARSNLDYDAAFEEVVADSMEKMFTDGNIMDKLTKLKAQDKGLLQRIKCFIDKWLSKIKEFYSAEGQYVTREGELAHQLEKFEQLQQLFAEALVDAGENYQSSLTPGEESIVTNENGDPVAYSTEDTKFSSRDPNWKPELDSTEWGIVNYTVDHNQGTAITSTCNMFFEKSKGRSVFGIYSTDDSTLLYASRGQTAEKEHIFVDLLREEYKNGNVADTSAKGLRAWAKTVRMRRTANSDHGIGNVASRGFGGNAELYGRPSGLYASAALRNVLENIFKEESQRRTGVGRVRQSDRTGESISNRSLLANAFESMAQNDIERQKIAEYKAKIETKEAEERKLRDLKEQIKELSFAKGPRDTAKLRALREEAIKTANRLSIYDSQLLRLEASKPLQNVLFREKKKAYDRAKTEGQKAKRAAMEGRNKTAMRHKIQNVVGGLQQDILTTK